MAREKWRTTRKGREDQMIFATGLSKRLLEIKRLIPTGGVEAPTWRLVRKMIPRWTGWIP